MGCDIHMWVEVLQPDGKWDTLSRPSTEKNLLGMAWGWADYRSYDTFAFLADVRNGYGTNDRCVPLARARGWPDDVSAEPLQKSDDYGDDGHSHSWFTLRELLESGRLQNFVSLQDDVLLAAGLHPNPGCVRMVFFFDN
jgi:hypothetical protein